VIGLIFMICQFFIDYAVFTIRLCSPYNFNGELAKYMMRNITIPEKQVSSPMMPKEFKWRTYFRFNQLNKIYALNGKITALKDIDAVLVVHDLPFYEFLQIGEILNTLPSVCNFHLSLVEFRFDFYLEESATDFQLEIIQRLHLKNSRKAFKFGYWPRITFYINERGSDLQIKVYIRPKNPKSKQRIFTRLELTGNRRWLKNVGIEKPSDFLNLKFDRLINQVLWLDIAEDEIRESELNRLTNGLWMRCIKNRQMAKGMAAVLIKNRKIKSCPVICRYRFNERVCLLKQALVQNESEWRLFSAVQKCTKAKAITDFQKRYCKTSKIKPQLLDIMRKAYHDWKTKRERDLYKRTGMQPLFQVQPHVSLLKIKRSNKKEPPDFKMKPINWNIQDK